MHTIYHSDLALPPTISPGLKGHAYISIALHTSKKLSIRKWTSMPGTSRCTSVPLHGLVELKRPTVSSMPVTKKPAHPRAEPWPPRITITQASP